MALSDIIEKIKSEASVKADELKAEYEKSKKELQNKHIEVLRKLDEDNNTAIDSESAKVKEKAEMEAEMEAKNELLSAKRELIEEVLQKAAENLAASERYEDLLAEMMKKADMESGTIIAAKGKEEATRNAISKAGRNYQLASDSADIVGGFILKSEKIEVDNSFETVLFNQLRQELEIELNKMLFA